MNVPTKADLEIRDMADEDFAIFFHEYIHFLQDITSFYGYMEIYSHGEYMRRAINEIYEGVRLKTTALKIMLYFEIKKLSCGVKYDTNIKKSSLI